MVLLRNSFGSLSDNLPIDSFISIHKDSYDAFINNKNSTKPCIYAVLKQIFPIDDSFGFSRIDFVDFSFKSPNVKLEDAKKKSLTYASDLYLKLRFFLFKIDEETGQKEIRAIKEQEVFCCSIPIMTNSASFIINGVEKIVVSQIHKSPGVFFSKKNNDDSSTNQYIATLNPYLGNRIEMLYENNSNISVRINKKKKFPIYYLLKALDFSHKEIIDFFYSSIDLHLDKDSKFCYIHNKNDYFFAGFIPNFDIYNEKYEIIFNKNKSIDYSDLIKLHKINKLYFKSSELFNNINIYDNIENINQSCEAKNLTPELFDQILLNKISSFKIINFTLKDFLMFPLSMINANYDLKDDFIFSHIANKIDTLGNLSIDLQKQRLHSLFFDNKNSNFFSVGRYKLNKVLNLQIDESITCYTKNDILMTLKKLLQIKLFNLEIEEIDNLSNRRIRCVGELVENQFRSGFIKLAKNAVDKLNSLVLDTANISDFIASHFVAKAIRDFFNVSELCQFMEQTNIISTLGHIRKISSLGTGGINRDRASYEIRDIHPTQYSRICPIETPDGQNVGLITSLATYAKINQNGFITAPYRKVFNGKITDEVVYLDCDEEYSCKISQVSKNFIRQNTLVGNLIPARHQFDFIMCDPKEITHIDINPKQVISLVAAGIPFLERNDMGRSLMGSNMKRQAVPLFQTEPPIVGTGMEKILVKDSMAAVYARNSGIVISIDADHIFIKKQILDDSSDDIVDKYFLKTFSKTNQNTTFHQRPIVKLNDFVSKDQQLTDGPSIKDDEIALGRNVLVAFMPWNGYNYEDSVVVSQRVIDEDLFTSFHIQEFQVIVRDTRLGPEEITRDLPNIPDSQLKYLDESGIIHLGASVKSGDILVGKISPKTQSAISSEEKLLRAIFGDTISDAKNCSLIVPPGISGIVNDVLILTKRGIEKNIRAQNIERKKANERKEQERIEIEALDNLFNIKIDTFLKENKIFLQNFKDNSSVLEKLSVKINDKNISNYFDKLKNNYTSLFEKIQLSCLKDISIIFDGDDLPPGVLQIVKIFVLSKSRLQPGDKMAGRHGNKGVISKIVPTEDMPYLKDGTPIDIILSPLGVIGRMNLGQILETHLGLISHQLAKTVNNMLREGFSLSDIKLFILNVLTDENLKSKILSMDDKMFNDFININKNGFYFETPVFDSCSDSQINEMFNKLNIDSSGQVDLYDGITGDKFDRKVTIGQKYMLKLHHLVDYKIHARSVGPYSLITQQPLGGKSQFGGQRLGEMEVWSLEAYGAAFTLRELLTTKSDDVSGRNAAYEAIIKGEENFGSHNMPASFHILYQELKALCFDVEVKIDLEMKLS